MANEETKTRRGPRAHPKSTCRSYRRFQVPTQDGLAAKASQARFFDSSSVDEAVSEVASMPHLDCYRGWMEPAFVILSTYSTTSFGPRSWSVRGGERCEDWEILETWADLTPPDPPGLVAKRLDLAPLDPPGLVATRLDY